MDDFEKEYRLSLYKTLTSLNRTDKCQVELVQNQLDGRIYIKKELINYNIDVYKLIQTINDKGIPKVYEIIEYNNKLYVVEEFINGNTLQTILDSKGILTEEVAIKYVTELCEILDKIHSLETPIIHRDIKPGNIIIDNDGRLKLIDFDVSRIYKDGENMDTFILGTQGYASPEQFGFEQTDCRSDIYSVGVLINMLTVGKLHRVQLNEGKLKGIIEKCTKISADERYNTIAELREDIIKVLSHGKSQKLKSADSFLIRDHITTTSVKDKKKKKSKLKIVMLTLWFAFLLFGLTVGEDGQELTFDIFLRNLTMTISLSLITLLNMNFLGVQRYVPIINKKDTRVTRFLKRYLPFTKTIDSLSKVSILSIYSFILIVIAGGILQLIESSFS